MEENRKYDDFAILEDVHDTYKNISLKLLSFLKYSEREFPDADFIGKIDDDTYLNLDVLAKSIRYLPSERYLISIKSHLIEFALVGFGILYKKKNQIANTLMPTGNLAITILSMPLVPLT